VGDGDTTANFNLAVTAVIRNAQPDNNFDAAPSGQYLLGIVEVFRGVSGTYQDDVNNETVAIGSNGQSYQPSFGGIAHYTNFDNGQVTVSARQTSVGAVTFDIPHGVVIDEITYAPGGGTPASWKV
jgi:hypothetical protein